MVAVDPKTRDPVAVVVAAAWAVEAAVVDAENVAEDAAAVLAAKEFLPEVSGMRSVKSSESCDQRSDVRGQVAVGVRR